MKDWVLTDTCIWAAFFSKPGSKEKQAVDRLIDEDRVAILGPIVGETLQGFRRKEQADWVASRLRMAHCPEIHWDDWREAANLGRELAANGHRLPLTDLVVATVANRLDCYVFTVDPHFDLIDSLKRFTP